MSAVAAATIGSAVIGGVVSMSAASKAGNEQRRAAEASAAEERAARKEMTRLLAPYTAAGGPALQGQMALLGIAPPRMNWSGYANEHPEILAAYNAQASQPNLGGMFGGAQVGAPKQSLEDFAKDYYNKTGKAQGHSLGKWVTTSEEAQQEAISQQEQSPFFQALVAQGEDAILQNASATGGLRGGNVQGALAQFRPSLLNAFIEQQYGRLGGMTELGQNSAAKVGAAGQTAATNIGNRLTEAGQARAGSALAQGQAFNTALGTITGFGTSPAGQKILGEIF